MEEKEKYLERIQQIQDCCYEDLKGNALSIVNLILNAYSQNNENIEKLIYNISEDEFNNRYFKNINWEAIVKIATAALSRKETLDYINSAKNF